MTARSTPVGSPVVGARLVIIVLASVLSGLLLPAGAASAEALQPPAGLAPVGSVSTPTPTFSWSRSPGASGYRLELDDDPGFASPLVSVTTSNAAYVHTARLRAGSWFWRVRATAGDQMSSWSSTDVTIDETAPPSQLHPAPGATLPQPDAPALLRWSPVTGATGYQVEIDADGDWVGADSFTSSSSSFQVPAPQEARTWSWRVRADLGGGEFTSWSTGSDYTIEPLAVVQPDPSMPTSFRDVVLKWLPVEGATKYELQVGLDRDFNNLVEPARTVVGTRYSPAITYDNDQYFWRVRAIDSAGNKMSWPDTAFVVQRNWPQRPRLLYPPHSLDPVGDDLYYQWTPVPHATRYQVDVGSDPNFSPNTFKSCRTASTTFVPGVAEAQRCMPAQGDTTYWRVRALDALRSPHVEGIYSEIQRFAYNSGRVQLLAPAHGAVVDVPTLRWAAQEDAVSYDVELRAASGQVVGSAITRSLSWTPSGSAKLDASKGPFSWTVQAIDSDGSVSPKYAGRSFTLSGTVPPPEGTPLQPHPVASSSRSPALSWEPVAGASYYKVRIGVSGSSFWDNSDSAPILQLSWPYPGATDTGERYLRPDTYDWQVRAVMPDGSATAWGQTGTFTVVDLPAVTGQRIALDGLAIDAGTACDLGLGETVSEDQICRGVPATPVLDWEPVPGAGLYMVYIANDRELTNRVYTGAVTSSSRWAPTTDMPVEALADNQAGESYYWYVRPCKTVTVCGPDPVSTGRAATNAFRKFSPAVTVVNPLEARPEPGPGGHVGTACETSPHQERPFEVSFHWEDYYCTNQQATFYGGEQPSHQAARGYRIEVASNPSFATPLQVAEVDQPTWTPVQQTLPEGDLWWRVQAVDARGNRLTWSTPTKYTKSSGAVTLTSPVDGVSTTGDPSFSWAAQRHAASYRLEVYGADDATHSTSNLRFSVDTKLASYVWNKFLPPAGGPYRWRVRWVDASGRPGPWSEDGRFVVSKHQLTLVGPADGTYLRPDAFVATWDPVPQATRYQVQVRTASGGSVSSTSTAATAWAATSTLADGAYEWRVSAFDPSNGELAQSVWRRFGVDTTRPAPVSWSPSTSARPSSAFRVKLSEAVIGVHSSTVKLYVKGRSTPLPSSVSLSADGRVVRLEPSQQLVGGKTYRVLLTAGIRDLAGNKLRRFSWEVRAKG